MTNGLNIFICDECDTLATMSVEGDTIQSNERTTMYKLTTAYDNNAPHHTMQFNNALDAVNAYNKCVDWGMANEYATYNLTEPSGLMHTKHFWRNGNVNGK